MLHMSWLIVLKLNLSFSKHCTLICYPLYCLTFYDRHLMINCREFRSHVKRQLRIYTQTSSEIDRKVHKEFPSWFGRRILKTTTRTHQISDLSQSALLTMQPGLWHTMSMVSSFARFHEIRDCLPKTRVYMARLGRGVMQAAVTRTCSLVTFLVLESCLMWSG